MILCKRTYHPIPVVAMRITSITFLQTICVTILMYSTVKCGFPDLNVIVDSECAELDDVAVVSTEVGSTINYSCKRFLLNTTSRDGFCPVEICQRNGNWTRAQISCAENECYRPGESHLYKGNRNCSISGKPCMPWTRVWHNIVTEQNDLRIPADTGSYCRDPDGLVGEPYCFLDISGKHWESCGIQVCKDFREVKDSNCNGDQARQMDQLSTAATKISTTESQIPKRILVESDSERKIAAINATSEVVVPLMNSKSHKRSTYGSVENGHVVLTKFKKRIPSKSEKVGTDNSLPTLHCARKCKSNVYCTAFDVDSGCKLHLLEGDEQCNNARFCYRKL